MLAFFRSEKSKHCQVKREAKTSFELNLKLSLEDCLIATSHPGYI